MFVRLYGVGDNGGDQYITLLKYHGFLERLVDYEESRLGEWVMIVEVKDDSAVQYLNAVMRDHAHFDKRVLSVERLDESEDEIAKRVADRAYMSHVRTTATDVGQKLNRDIDHQVSKYGPQRVDGFGWLAILTEEFGETAQAYLKKEYDEAIAEARQTIACLSRFITEVQREKAQIAQREKQWYERAK